MSDSVTLVILSDDWEATSSDEHGELLVASVVNGELVVSGVSHDIPDRRFRLPAEPYRISSTADGDDWRAVVKWLSVVVGDDAVVVVDYHHPIRDLILYASAALGMRYALRFTAAPERSGAPIFYAVISNADAMVFESEAVADEFHRQYLAPYVSVRSLVELRDLVSVRPRSSPEIDPRSSAHSNSLPSIRVLIVAYFSGPCRTVGVQRPNYWFEELAGLTDGLIEPHIASTTDWGGSVANVHVVPDYNVATLAGPEGTYPAWAADLVASERRDANVFNTLSYYWRYGLEKYFDELDDRFDVVIVSGNPFSCFDFAAYAKRRWHARVILDYRDPFGNNPRFNYTDEARDHARYVEQGFNFQADVISVVNEYCIDLVEGALDADIINIPNGFDERVLDSVRRVDLPSDKVNIVHAESFTRDRSPEHILAALDPERHAFHHVGNTSGVKSRLLDNQAVVQHGRLPYVEVLGVVGGADIGIVFLSEQNFETTTKLFDYLAMGIDVLLCTNGAIGSGAVAGVLEGQEGVFWCRNNAQDAARFIAEYKPAHRLEGGTSGELFTRRHGTRLLAARIIDLVGR